MSGSWLFDWIIWTSLVIGLAVAGLVYMVGGVLRPIRLGKNGLAFREEDVPWEELLDLMKARYSDGKSVENEELPPDELMQSLISQIPGGGVPPPDANWTNGTERRRSLRRWFNPIEVVLISPFHDHPLHGLVVNRSIGGLAILADVDFDADTVLSVRPMNAPAGVGYVEVHVRHTRKASKLWVLGCQYKEDVAWNVKVWFG